MKTKILIAALAAVIGFAPAVKADELFTEQDLGGKFSANVSLVNEYILRGITQSGDGNPALQGGFDFAHDSGFYVGTWASSLNFGGNIETDLYAGWSTELGAHKIGLDIGAIYYHYPSASGSLDLDYWEAYIGVSKDFDVAAAGLKLYYSPDWTGISDESAVYIEGTLDIPVGKYFTVNLLAGHQWYEQNNVVGFDDYWVYSAGVSTQFAGFTAKIAYVGVDIPDAQLTAYGQKEADKLFLSLSREF